MSKLLAWGCVRDSDAVQRCGGDRTLDGNAVGYDPERCDDPRRNLALNDECFAFGAHGTATLLAPRP
jgi:hypothetical protein